MSAPRAPKGGHRPAGTDGPAVSDGAGGVGGRLGRVGWVLRGLLVAGVVAALLWPRPLARATLASPVWSRLSSGLGERICTRRVLLGATLAAGLGSLLGWVADGGVLELLGGLLLAAGVVVWAVPAGRAVYPHTLRGRVRTRYGLDGWASWWELRRTVSAHAVRRAAVATRPSIADRVDPLTPTPAPHKNHIAESGREQDPAAPTAAESTATARNTTAGQEAA